MLTHSFYLLQSDHWPYIVSTWFVAPFFALFVMGFRNWRWPLPHRILLDPWKTSVHLTKTVSLWLKSTTNWESSASSKTVYGNPLVFQCSSFSFTLSCFHGHLNFLVLSYLLSTGGRRRERCEWFNAHIRFTLVLSTPYYLLYSMTVPKGSIEDCRHVFRCDPEASHFQLKLIQCTPPEYQLKVQWAGCWCKMYFSAKDGFGESRWDGEFFFFSIFGFFLHYLSSFHAIGTYEHPPQIHYQTADNHPI